MSLTMPVPIARPFPVSSRGESREASSFLGPLQRRPVGSRLKAAEFQTAMRKMLQLRPDHAYVAWLRKSNHLSLQAAYAPDGQQPGEYILALWAEILKIGKPHVQRGHGCWTLCAPLKDAQGRISGLIYADCTACGKLDQGALERLLAWAETPQKTVVRVRPARLDSRSFAAMLGSLAVMLEAGLPLQRGLRQLAQDAQDGPTSALAQALALDLERGRSFSQGCARHPQQFAPLHIGLLRMAEATGGMDTVLGMLADFEEKRNVTLLKVRSALVYPAMLLLLCTIGLLLAPPLLLQSQFQLIHDLHVDPPLLTRALMSFAAAMRTPVPYLAAFGLAAALWMQSRRWRSDRPLQIRWTRRILRLGAAGELLRTLLTTRFARALAVQLQAGVGALEAVQLASQACGNPLMEEVAQEVGSHLMHGRSLALSLKRTGFFRPVVISVVHSGETTGSLPQLIGWLAELGEQEVDQALETVTSMLEPMVMAFLGGVVGTMVLATMLPLSRALEAL